MTSSPPSPGPVALVGAGAVGHALADALGAAGIPVTAVLSRSAHSAETLGRRTGAATASDRLADLPADARLVVLCVPDAAVAPVAAALGAQDHPWRTTVVAHTAGSLGADVLAPLAARGAAALAFHPVQTFARGAASGAGAAAFQGIYVGLGGTPAALDAGRTLAAALGARTVVIPDDARARYHLATSIASNFFVVLLALVDEVLATTGVPREDAGLLVRPLVEGTWANLRAARPEEALTGPVARGDAGTVAAHVEALAGHLPHLLPVYGALAAEAVRVAVRGGQLGGEGADHVLDVLQRALDGA